VRCRFRGSTSRPDRLWVLLSFTFPQFPSRNRGRFFLMSFVRSLTKSFLESTGRLWYGRKNRLRDEAASVAGLSEEERERLGQEREAAETSTRRLLPLLNFPLLQRLTFRPFLPPLPFLLI